MHKKKHRNQHKCISDLEECYIVSKYQSIPVVLSCCPLNALPRLLIGVKSRCLVTAISVEDTIKLSFFFFEGLEVFWCQMILNEKHLILVYNVTSIAT